MPFEVRPSAVALFPTRPKAGPPPVEAGEWNRYEVAVTGNRIQTTSNGTPWFDLADADGARRGIIALQLPAGTAEVCFKDLRLELVK
jgi:hypothetical protein